MPMEQVPVSSDPTRAAEALGPFVEPPRNWPQCFSLKGSFRTFLTKVLKGSRVRLVGAPAGTVDADAADCKKIVGFAIAESELHHGAYVATPSTWLEHAGVWILPDCSPGVQRVLVESAVSPAAAAAAVSSIAAAATKPTADAPVDVSDGGHPSPNEPPQKPPKKEAPSEPAEPLPPTSASKPAKGKAAAPTVHGMWRSRDEVRMVARDADEEKQGRRSRKTIFPGKKGQVRLVLHESGEAELEARRWGEGADGLRDGADADAPRREPALFDPLEYGDKDASALRVRGKWKPSGKLGDRDVVVQVEDIEEVTSSADAPPPPITTKEIHYACGKSLGRPLHLLCNKDTSALIIQLNEYLEKRVLLMRLDDGLLDKKKDHLGPPPPSLYTLPPSAAMPGGSHYAKPFERDR